MRRFLLGIVVGALLIAFGGDLIRAALGSTQTASATLAPTAGPSGTAGIAQQITSIDAALALAKTSGKAVSVTLTFSERDLTTQAAAYFPQSVSGATLSDPVVHLRTGQIVLDMSAQITFVRTTAEAIASVAVRAGRPAATVTSATIGGASVPQSTSDQVATQLNEALGAGLPPKFSVSSLSITNGVMTVVGVANP